MPPTKSKLPSQDHDPIVFLTMRLPLSERRAFASYAAALGKTQSDLLRSYMQAVVNKERDK